eukprot:CAMPEP_0174733694 /NCGR_PEP_ID=MMETSP1094-20130205/61845_1 /TAXON_ID=156173 /ORGANISM="Chrysochromulina brevifilum, Strain UTEX LB 985" /LENGTH=71 /DNA_ID=CAMNT_0015936391 /DNA_START=132 /DNA_END=344 /DNA_ORIENTATION=-
MAHASWRHGPCHVGGAVPENVCIADLVAMTSRSTSMCPSEREEVHIRYDMSRRYDVLLERRGLSHYGRQVA